MPFRWNELKEYLPRLLPSTDMEQDTILVTSMPKGNKALQVSLDVENKILTLVQKKKKKH